MSEIASFSAFTGFGVYDSGQATLTVDWVYGNIERTVALDDLQDSGEMTP